MNTASPAPSALASLRVVRSLAGDPVGRSYSVDVLDRADARRHLELLAASPWEDGVASISASLTLAGGRWGGTALVCPVRGVLSDW